MSDKPCLKCGGTGTRILKDEFAQAVLACDSCGGGGVLRDKAKVGAGRKLDALVATEVMGLDASRSVWDAMWHIPQYSTDISAAWEVVEKLGKGPTICEIEHTYAPNSHDTFAWHARLGMGEASADTAPLAICLAALKAVGEGVE